MNLSKITRKLAITMNWELFKPIGQIIKKKMVVSFNRKYKFISFNAAASKKMKKYVNIGVDVERKAVAIEPKERKDRYSVKLHNGGSCSRIASRKLFDRLEELMGRLDGKHDMKWMEDEKCFVIKFGGVAK
ncbi:hypothetical protein [Pectinatus frisingensis]|uniref:hypothetical protein n=1 Tax=Pectinatus frisingensis TaxID=865 RepID=UPI0018C45DA3|nr:hypothetical protein [Pectinatus frisingensis]